jgi:hypothetical protein
VRNLARTSQRGYSADRGQDTVQVEFARSSRTRDGAPTLVPVSEGGAHVCASVLVLDDADTVGDARDILYRRETGRR